MAFSWNPFARKQAPAQQEQQSPLTVRNPNYPTFNKVNNDIERAVSLKSIIPNSLSVK